MVVLHVALAALGFASLAPLQPATNWAADPEAVFMTAAERREWKSLRSADEHETFKADYWRKRDPTPTTQENEFHQRIQQRIAEADERYAIGQTRGSQTARGKVFVLLGPPAVERALAEPLDRQPRMDGNRMVLPPLDEREWHTWVYDREQNQDLLATIGRHSLEIAFVIEPGTRDQLQSSSLFAAVRDRVAAASLVKP